MWARVSSLQELAVSAINIYIYNHSVLESWIGDKIIIQTENLKSLGKIIGAKVSDWKIQSMHSEFQSVKIY